MLGRERRRLSPIGKEDNGAGIAEAAHSSQHTTRHEGGRPAALEDREKGSEPNGGDASADGLLLESVVRALGAVPSVVPLSAAAH